MVKDLRLSIATHDRLGQDLSQFLDHVSLVLRFDFGDVVGWFVLFPLKVATRLSNSCQHRFSSHPSHLGQVHRHASMITPPRNHGQGGSKLTEHLTKVLYHGRRVIISYRDRDQSNMHNVVSSNQRRRNLAIVVKLVKRDVRREPSCRRTLREVDIQTF